MIVSFFSQYFMIKQFTDVKSLNVVFMFKYMFCKTQNLTDQCDIVTD